MTIKYFISYKNFIENNIIDKKIDIYSDELKIAKKHKDGSITLTPILYFKGYTENFLDYADKFCDNKRGLSLIVELTKEEASKFDPLYVRKLISSDANHFEVMSDEIKLINYSSLVYMSIKEMNSGTVHKTISLKSSKSVPECFEINLNENDIFRFSSVREKRENLINENVGADLYFYTDSEELLEKYKDNLTIIKEVDDGLYKIVSHKLFIIDSIPISYVNDLTNSSMKCLYDIGGNSVSVSIKQNDDNTYDISLGSFNSSDKKGYLFIGTNLNNILSNTAVLPLLKYINVYELKDGKYIKMNIEDYMKLNDTLKYIKKPSKN